jgi:protein MAK16
MKTAERAHLPSELWEKVRLNKSYTRALEEIDEQLIYWSPFIIHKCKQRLTKLRQMLIQMRKLKLQGKEELVPIKKKAEKRDRIREAKALIAANIEQKIEEELMERLKTGVYKDIYNYNPKVFNRLVGREEEEDEEMEEENDQFIPEE